MNIVVTTMFLLPLVVVTFYLYVSGAFSNQRAFQFAYFILLGFSVLTIGIGIQYSCQSGVWSVLPC